MTPAQLKLAIKLGSYAALAVALFGAHVAYSNYYKKVGRLKCEAKAAAANEKTLPIVDIFHAAKDEARHDEDEQRETIRTEVRTGITTIDLERARREARNTGEELGRAKAIAAYRAQGGCLSDPLAGDDGLLVIGQDQQRAIFGRVIGSGEDEQAESVRQNAAGYPIP